MSRTTDSALTLWPLVVLDVSAGDPAAGARRVEEVLTAALERREPFVAVLRMPEGRPHRLAGAGDRVRLMAARRRGGGAAARGLRRGHRADDRARRAGGVRPRARRVRDGCDLAVDRLHARLRGGDAGGGTAR